MTNRRVFVFFVGADSRDNRYGVISPVLVDSHTLKPPVSGEFEFLPILDTRPPQSKKDRTYISPYTEFSYADLSPRIQKVKLEELIRSAWRQRYEIMSKFWENILREVSTRTSKSYDTILDRLGDVIKKETIDLRNKLRSELMKKPGMDIEEINEKVEKYGPDPDEVDYSIEEIRESLSNQNFDELSSKRAQQILESVAHADPVVDENRRILSYGDHPTNLHGVASVEITENDIILFVTRLVRWNESEKRFVAREKMEEYYYKHCNGYLKTLETIEHIVTKNSFPFREEKTRGKSLNEIYKERLSKLGEFHYRLVSVPYVYDYYFVGFLVVDEILKIDNIVEEFKRKRGREKLEEKDISEIKSYIETLAMSNKRIRENPHFHRFMNADNTEKDIMREATWIILGKEDSRLFDKAVIIGNKLLYKELLNYIVYFDERRDECEEKTGKFKKSCYLRGSYMIVGEGVDIVKVHLKEHGIDIDL